jgi:hypothetical protein
MSAYSTDREHDASLAVWSRARDVLAGEDAVKSAGTKYLPRMDSQSDQDCQACKARASFFGSHSSPLSLLNHLQHSIFDLDGFCPGTPDTLDPKTILIVGTFRAQGSLLVGTPPAPQLPSPIKKGSTMTDTAPASSPATDAASSPSTDPQLAGRILDFPRLPGETPRAYSAFTAFFLLGQARPLQHRVQRPLHRLASAQTPRPLIRFHFQVTKSHEKSRKVISQLRAGHQLGATRQNMPTNHEGNLRSTHRPGPPSLPSFKGFKLF